MSHHSLLLNCLLLEELFLIHFELDQNIFPLCQTGPVLSSAITTDCVNNNLGAIFRFALYRSLLFKILVTHQMTHQILCIQSDSWIRIT